MKFQSEQFEIEITDESVWRNSSRDNSRQYSKDYLLGEDFQNAPRYGVIVKSLDGSIDSCIVRVNGGTTTVHTSSVVIRDSALFLAIGNSICCFAIPVLALKWHQKVDMATCFGVYLSPDNQGIISHGEVDIAKVGFNGKIEWSVSGKDIFSEGFQLFPDHIETIDFNHEEYRVEISTGQISIRSGG